VWVKGPASLAPVAPFPVERNYPDAIALLSTQLLELIRDGRSVAEIMDIGRTILGRNQDMDGIPELVTEVQVEGT
jgi:urease subunit gamma/beta